MLIFCFNEIRPAVDRCFSWNRFVYQEVKRLFVSCEKDIIPMLLASWDNIFFFVYTICGGGSEALFYHYQRGVFHDAFTLFDADGCHLAIFLGLDVVGHLHGFQHNNRVAGLYLVAYMH